MRLLRLWIFLCACAAAFPALGDTKVLSQAGAWQAFGGTTTSGRGVCGVSMTAPDQSYFGVKLFAGDQTFTIQMGSKAWKIVNQSKTDLSFQFDAFAAWKAVGTGMHFNDGDAGLEFTVNSNEMPAFLRELRNSQRLRIRFSVMDMTDWNLDLAGVKSVSDAMEGCILRMK